jgi:hypothetical protein
MKTLTDLTFKTGNVQSTRVRITFGTRVAKECNVLRSLARRSSSLVMLLLLFCAEHTYRIRHWHVKDSRKTYHSQLRKQIEKFWYHIAIRESEILLPCQCQIPRFEVNYGICVCKAGLDFVYFIRYNLLRGAKAQSVLISRLPKANFSGLPTVKENLRLGLKSWDEIIK